MDTSNDDSSNSSAVLATAATRKRKLEMPLTPISSKRLKTLGLYHLPSIIKKIPLPQSILNNIYNDYLDDMDRDVVEKEYVQVTMGEMMLVMPKNRGYRFIRYSNSEYDFKIYRYNPFTQVTDSE